MIEAIPANELDKIATDIIFFGEYHHVAIDLLKFFINQEVQSTTDSGVLFS